MSEQNTQRILVVEDEESLARYLQLELNHEGYLVEMAQNGYEAMGRIAEEQWDLLILDLMLPGLDGLEICKRVRERLAVPIIMLTARDTVADKIKGLDFGADDYMTKPFAVEELLARIRARLRSSPGFQRHGNKLTTADLTIDMDTREAERKGVFITLSRREFDLLAYMVQNAGVVLTRDAILSNVWGYDFFGNTNVVDVYIRYLRAKIDDPFEVRLLHTVRGVGYILREGE